MSRTPTRYREKDLCWAGTSSAPLSLWERRTKTLTRPSAGLSQRERRTKTLWERVGVRGANSAASPHSPRPSCHVSAPPAGLTLVELLVVVTIMVMLTVFAVPVLTPSLESRRVREAARQINVYLSQARNRAIEKNQPVGVWFQRRQGQNQAVTALFMAEESAPYGGADWNSRIQVTPTSGNQAKVAFLSDPPGEDPVSAGLVRPGDRIQLNFQGPIWEITGIAGNTWTFRLLSPSGTPTPRAPAGLPFQIFRQPQPQRSLASPLNLPVTLAIDTQWSGIGVGDWANIFAPASDTDTNPIVIMFSPTGEVKSVWYQGTSVRPTEVIFLLMGKLNRIPTSLGGTVPAEDGLRNWQDLGNLWVTITPQTGMVKTVEVASGADPVASRRIARQGQSIGGK